MSASTVIDVVARTAMPVLVVAVALALYRLVRGPTGPDRVVALDLVAILAAGLMGVYAIAEQEAVYVDTAIVTMMINFLATVALAHYIGRRRPSPNKEG